MTIQSIAGINLLISCLGMYAFNSHLIAKSRMYLQLRHYWENQHSRLEFTSYRLHTILQHLDSGSWKSTEPLHLTHLRIQFGLQLDFFLELFTLTPSTISSVIPTAAAWDHRLVSKQAVNATWSFISETRPEGTRKGTKKLKNQGCCKVISFR